MKHYIFIDENRKQERKNQLEKDLLLIPKEDIWGVSNLLNRYSSSCNVKYALFYAFGDFVLIEYNDDSLPNNFISEVEFVEDIIKKYHKSRLLKTKKLLSINTYRGVTFVSDEQLRGERNRQRIFNDVYMEVNYTYSNAVGKEYCICSELVFKDLLTNYSLTRGKYKNAKSYLKSINLFNTLEGRLNYLYNRNTIVNLSEYKIVQTVDQLIRNLKIEIS